MKGFQKCCYRLSLLCLLFWFVLNLSACSTAWVTSAIGIVNMLGPILSSIFALIGALGGKIGAAADAITKWVNEAAADLQNVVLPLLNSYNDATAADKPGILNKIHDAIKAIQANTAALLSSLHIEDQALQAKITAIIGIVESTLVSLINFVPVAAKLESVAGHQGAQKEILLAADKEGLIPHSAGQLKKSYNAALTQKTGDPELDQLTPEFVVA